MEVCLGVITHAGDCQARIHTLDHNNLSVLTTDFLQSSSRFNVLALPWYSTFCFRSVTLP